MPWISNVKALMQTWYLGSVAGDAIADIISGDINLQVNYLFISKN
jgi:beta-glucosidase